MTGSRLYETWVNMKTRCYNKNKEEYKYYGDKGIKICDEWLHSFTSFYNWSINNGYTDVLTIDRMNVEGNYEPNNCRWVTMKVQGNNRTTNINITIGTETKTLKEWCENKKINYHTVYGRYIKMQNNNEEIDLVFLFGKENKSFVMFTYDNKTLSLAEWSRYFNIKYKTFMGRYYKYGFDINQLSKPIGNNAGSRWQ